MGILGPSSHEKQEASAAAVGPGVAAVDLLDVKLFRGERALLRALPAFCAQIAFVRSVPAPFPQAAPEAAKRPFREFCHLPHQSSPCAAPVKPSAHFVATYGASCNTASRRPLRIAYHCASASTSSTRIIRASTPVTAASSRWLKIRRCVSAIFAAG